MTTASNANADIAILRRKGIATGRSSGCSVGGFAWAVATDLKKSGSVPEQVAASLARIDEILTDLGTNRRNIVSATLYLTNVAHREEMDAVWREWIGTNSAHWPQRACLITGLSPGTLFEISVVAATSVILTPECTNE